MALMHLMRRIEIMLSSDWNVALLFFNCLQNPQWHPVTHCCGSGEFGTVHTGSMHETSQIFVQIRFRPVSCERTGERVRLRIRPAPCERVPSLFQIKIDIRLC